MNTFVLTFIILEVIAAALLAGIVFLLAKPKQKTSENVTETTAEEETAATVSSEPLADVEPEEPAAEIHTDDGAETDDEPVFSEIAAADATAENPSPVPYRLAKSFTAKLILSADELKARYSEIKNALLSYKKVKARTSWKCETYRFGRTTLAKMAVRGKKLCLYLALSPEDIPGEKYKVENVKRKASAVTPTVYKIKNALRVKHAKQLITVLAEKFALTPFERQTENYAPAQMTEEELLAKGLIRKVKSVPFVGR